jgi:hypothetical protein
VWKSLKASYAGVGESFSRYWVAYGGIKAFLLSPYLHVSIVLTALMFPYWLYKSWWETSLAILPNVLGFTLAGFTIWLGFGDEKFRELISKAKPNKTSVFMGVSSTFAHFVVAQILALLAALWAKAMDFPLAPECSLYPHMVYLSKLGFFIGYLLFIYALMSALAAALGVLRTASWFDRHRRNGDTGGKPVHSNDEQDNKA